MKNISLFSVLLFLFHSSYSQGDVINANRRVPWWTVGNSLTLNPASPAVYGTTTIGTLENFAGTTDAQDFVLGTNQIERMRIKQSTGLVGIGTAAPSQRLHVTGNFRLDNAFMPGNNAGTAGQYLQSQGAGLAPTWVNAPIGVTGPTGAAGTNGTNGAVGPTGAAGAVGPTGAAGTNGTNGAVGATGATGPLVAGTSGQTLRHDGTTWVANSVIYNDGTKVGIGTTTPSAGYMLEVNGRLKTAGINELSDERFKTGITTITDALQKLLSIRGTEYFWKTEEFPQYNFEKEKQIGVIAQEVEKVLPEVVRTDDKGYKAVDYSKIIALLIEAIKEQNVRLGVQEKQIQELHEQIKK